MIFPVASHTISVISTSRIHIGENFNLPVKIVTFNISVLFSMLNIPYLFLFVLLPVAATAQNNWTTLTIDPHIEFSLPAQHSKTETPEMLDIQAFGNSSIMRFLKIPQPQAQIENVDGLKRYYESYRDMVLTSSNGKLLRDEHEMTGDLTTYLFTVKFDNLGIPQTQQSRLLFAHGTLYVFTFGTVGNEWDDHQDEHKRFMTGIRFVNLDPEDQLTVHNPNDGFAEILGSIFKYSVIAAVVLSLILWYRKKYELVKRIKNFFAMAFLVWGAVNIFLGLANFLYGVKQWPMVILGLSLVIIGWGLKKIPVFGEGKAV
jgi:hypothetical protein